MKTLLGFVLTLFALLPCIAQGPMFPGPGARSAAVTPIAVINKCPTAGIVHGFGPTTVTCQFNSALTPGSHIVAFGNVVVGPSSISIADTVNTYTAVGWSTTGVSADSWNAWCAPNSSSSALTLTLTTPSDTDLYLGAVEISNGTCTVDQQLSTASQGLTSGTFGTNYANSIVFAMAAGGNGSAAPVAGSIGGNSATLIGGTMTGSFDPGWEYYVTTTVLGGTSTASFTTAPATVYVQEVSIKHN